MKENYIIEMLKIENPEARVLVGFDEALIGITADYLPAYSILRIINILEKNMSSDEAWEYYLINIESLNLGGNYMVFIDDYNYREEE